MHKEICSQLFGFFSVSKTLVNKQKACKSFSQSLPIPLSYEFQLITKIVGFFYARSRHGSQALLLVIIPSLRTCHPLKLGHFLFLIASPIPRFPFFFFLLDYFLIFDKNFKISI
jgi:hypothetical protein